MSKSWKFKLIVFLLGILLFSAGGLIIYLNKIISPAELNKIIYRQLQAAFPSAQVKVGQVDFSLGSAIKFTLSEMEVRPSSGEAELFSTKDLVAKIPIWSILTGGGVAEIKLDNPLINYSETAQGNNWSLAMGKKAGESEKIAHEATPSAIVLPGFLSRSKLNLRVTDIKVNYFLKDGKEGQIQLSRFLLKNINFKEPTAFELASKIDVEMEKGKRLNFEGLLIGQFDLSEYVRSSTFFSTMHLKIENLKISEAQTVFPPLNTNIELSISKDGAIKGKLESVFNEKNSFKSAFEMTQQKIELRAIDLQISLEDMLEISGLKVAGFSPGQAVFSGKGDLSVDLSRPGIEGLNPKLEFKLTPAVKYDAGGVDMQVEGGGNLSREQFNLTANAKLMEGEASLNLSAPYVANNAVPLLQQIKSVQGDIRLEKLKVDSRKVNSLLYPEVKAKAATEAEKNTERPASPPSAGWPSLGLPGVDMNLAWDKVDIGGNLFQGKGKIRYEKNQIKIKPLDFNYSNGSGDVSATVTLDSNKMNSEYFLRLQNLDLTGIQLFLPPMMDKLSGKMSGTVSGTASLQAPNPPVYDAKVEISATEGKLKGVDISEMVLGVVDSLPVLKKEVSKEKKYKIDGDFEQFNLSGRFKNTQYSLNSFRFVGIKKKMEMNGAGNVFPPLTGKTGTVDFIFIDHTGALSGPMEKNLGTKELPVRVSGVGFDLKPDYAYTLKKVGKLAIKTQVVPKVKQMAKQELKKVGEKLLEKQNDKVKKLFKGLLQ